MSRANCYDCHRPYGDEFGFPDLIVPLDIWKSISPTGDEGGLLCPSCICQRANQAGLHNVPVEFRSGPFVRADLAVLEAEAWDRADRVYNERNRLIAYLASLFPSVLERQEEEWEDGWRWIVFVHHPQGQLSWHIHDSELPLFDHVPRGIGNVKWDGHTTEEKYQRIAKAIRKEVESE